MSPAITRAVTMFEVDTRNRKRKTSLEPPRPDNFDLDITFVSGNSQVSEVFNYTADLNVQNTDNVLSYSVYINNNYVGDNLNVIQITTGDTLKIIVIKTNPLETASLKTVAFLI